MTIISRIKRIISANLSGLIEKAEDPEALLKEMIREMDDNIIKMRNEIVKSAAAEKRLARQIEATGKKVLMWRKTSEKAVRDNDEPLARSAMGRTLQEERKLPEMMAHHKRAVAATANLKKQLRLLEDKVQDARRRKELLVARKQSAMAHQAMQRAARDFTAAARTSDTLLAGADLPATIGVDSLADEVLRLETEAEAMQEVMAQTPSLDEVFEQTTADEEIERRIQELKKKFGK